MTFHLKIFVGRMRERKTLQYLIQKCLITKKKFIVFLFFIFIFPVRNLFAALHISIPKSGTHLLFKAVENITGKKIIFESNMQSSINNHSLIAISIEDLDLCLELHKKSYLHSHLSYSKERAVLLDSKKIIVLLNIRDPRDQAISRPHAVTITFNDLLTDIIKNINNWYNRWLPWMNYPYAITVHFEDLVGSKGGGNDSRQLAAVKAIAKYLSVDLSEERAEEIATNLFGDNAGTFRKGKIGAWKDEFTPDHKELFKHYGGELLIKLGYEKDLNW